MKDKHLVEPDLKFIEEILQNGGDSLKKCFQCATCSVACRLSSDQQPFPRKEMIYASWGLKDRLMGNPDICCVIIAAIALPYAPEAPDRVILWGHSQALDQKSTRVRKS